MRGTKALEEPLAVLLRVGTWLASAVIAVGLASSLADSHWGGQIVNLGIALFILLPTVRVAVMLVAFVRERDFRFAWIAGFVLAMIVLGMVLGVDTKAPR
jgi:uncharacterized membrane protein